MILSPTAILHKFSAVLIATLKPLGIWGLGGLAIIDSGFIPIPVSMDGVLIGYVANDHGKFLLYCLMASVGSVLGSMVPYYVGRAGGELFLLKRINRERYESIRDRFERQEFVAIMFPAMMPPPMPMKIFEFAAGVFEMKPALFATAVFTGKFIQFLACALVTIFFGPTIVRTAQQMIHHHFDIVLGTVCGIALAAVLYFVRKHFDRRRKAKTDDADEDEDATLIT